MKNVFELGFKNGLISSLKSSGSRTEFIWPGMVFGNVRIDCRKKEGKWESLSTETLSPKHCDAVYEDKKIRGYISRYEKESYPVAVSLRFYMEDEALKYVIELENLSKDEVEIGGLSIAFPMNSCFDWGKKADESVLRHHFISGDNSFMYWMRLNSAPPHLMMTPQNGTALEYFTLEPENHIEKARIFHAYIHSESQRERVRERGGRWRQEHSSAFLKPKGTKSSSKEYGFEFRWVEDYDDMRKTIVREGMIDVEVIPSMTVVQGKDVLISLKTDKKIERLESEFPVYMEITKEKTVKNRQIYRVRFEKLGENYIKVHYGREKKMLLEFFVTEDIGTLIKKRAAFIASHQIKDKTKWYDGLFCEWNMESETLLTPDNYDRIKGWRIYEVTCDDPGLGKPAFLAEKNSRFPEQREVEALDYYIENFVWGGLQRTDEEEYSYGIYGIPDWKQNRESEDMGPKGKTHLWRIYDYPHIALMYFRMYQIASFYPGINTKLSAEKYLERAYRTALTMFSLPVELDDWSAYKTGLYNELVIPEIYEALFDCGKDEKALRLKRRWHKKAGYFVNQCDDLFGSEYPYDSTGFESTHVLAKYAMENAREKKGEREKDVLLKEDAKRFMEAQMEGNLMCRGWLEPAYYLLGSDYRADGGAAYTLSYMSQMGGWALLDYAALYSGSPQKHLRLGYASFMSSWALMNTGTEETGYGFWYPGKANDGGAGGGFEPAPYGRTWLDQEHHRGSWYYSCEIDLGYCGALRSLPLILAEDPVFGAFCYGGSFGKTEDGYKITAEDNARQRLIVIMDKAKMDISLEGALFSADTPVEVAGGKIMFSVVCGCEGGANARICIRKASKEKYTLFAGGPERKQLDIFCGGKAAIKIPQGKTVIEIKMR